MLLFGARSNANSITSCSKFLWQPIQANPALQNTHSTRVNDARMQSLIHGKASISIAFSYLIIHLLLTMLFFLIILTAELLDPWLDLLSV